ncbi:hypothetical protein HID58_002040 [Brassica napus]|uniref:Uncharacterized protein n=1 Tax=Brassica napus TaxID=3708 RepID=A0ABQ8EL70_BRANA|nr:hypothetical protein HID58_002040 [Brassica napus]
MRITRDLAPRHQTCTEDLQTEAIFRGTPDEKNVTKPLKITGPSGLIERTENQQRIQTGRGMKNMINTSSLSKRKTYGVVSKTIR